MEEGGKEKLLEFGQWGGGTTSLKLSLRKEGCVEEIFGFLVLFCSNCYCLLNKSYEFSPEFGSKRKEGESGVSENENAYR